MQVALVCPFHMVAGWILEPWTVRWWSRLKGVQHSVKVRYGGLSHSSKYRIPSINLLYINDGKRYGSGPSTKLRNMRLALADYDSLATQYRTI